MAWKTHVTDFDARFKCLYCSNDLLSNKWYSDFIGSLHYKTTRCNCGRHVRIKVNFLSSGRDSWHEKHFKSNSQRLEEKVEIPN